jgi:hypothetical protein
MFAQHFIKKENPSIINRIPIGGNLKTAGNMAKKNFFQKFKEGKLFAFLKKSGSNVLDIAGDVTGIEELNNVADLIAKDDNLTPGQKKEALELYKLELAELDQWLNYNINFQKEISVRHKNDMASDSWLSKNIRPLTLAFFIAAFFVFAILEGSINNFSIDDSYKEILKNCLLLAIGFYFGIRGYEKAQHIKNNKKKS